MSPATLEAAVEQRTWWDDTPRGADEPPDPEPPETEPSALAVTVHRCVCGLRFAGRPIGSSCVRCGALLCSTCGHAEGKHGGDWVRGRVSCLVSRCECECFRSEVLERMGDS